MAKRKDCDNQWAPPRPDLDFDLEGPSAEYLVDTSDIYDQVVYQHIHAKAEEWNIVSESEAEPHLPKRKKPLTVALGIQEKTNVELPTFGSVKLSDHLKYKKGYVLNTGSSIWGLDFISKLASVDSNPLTQYLAVGGYRGSVEEHLGMDEIQPTGSYKNCIQIWKLKLTVQEQPEDPILDLCLLHEYGVIYDLRWCPYGTYEEDDVTEGLPKLGILSFACGDRTIRTIIVPHPNAVRKHMIPDGGDPSKTVYMNIKSSRCVFTIKGSTSMSLSWGGHKKLASGWSYGNVVVWDMQSALADNTPKDEDQSKRFVQLSVLPLDATIRCITWNGIKNPERMMVGGYDGKLTLLDTNDPSMTLAIVRSRNIMNSCTWASHSSAMLFVDGDNTIRGLSFNENGSISMFKFGDSQGFCWEMAASEHHGQFAVGSSIGWLSTSNLYQVRTRKLLVNQVIVYKLNYSEDTKTYRYIDGIGLKTLDDSKKLPTYQQYGESYMAIQKVVWNPNKRTSAFIASGGAAGLCRIEFEGRGSKWE